MFRLAHIQWSRIPTGHHHKEFYFGSGNQSTERTKSRALYVRIVRTLLELDRKVVLGLVGLISAEIQL